MSSDLTSLSYVVLALVGRNGASPHDLVRMTREGQRLYYAGAASKIYDQPKRLARLGYLHAEKRPGKTRERTYYTLTPKGLAALSEWLGRPSSFPRIQSDAVARVLASDLAPDHRVVLDSLRSLRADIADLEAIIAADERRAASIPHRERQLKLVRSLGRRLLQAHLEWLDEVERELPVGDERRPADARSTR